LQRCIASNESSGIDIVVQIILTELTALTEQSSNGNPELGMLTMRLKSNASKTLLAVMESHQDMDIIDRIMLKIGNPDSLVRRWAGLRLLCCTSCVCVFAWGTR